MALNPVAYTEKVVGNFLRYQLTAYPFADPDLYGQMRRLLSLEVTRRTPLLRGPYVSLSRAFRQGVTVQSLIDEGVFHSHLGNLIPYLRLYGHQEKAIRAIAGARTTLVSTGTGSGKTECFLYPIISGCLRLRDEEASPGIVAVLVYPMNALAEDQLLRLRELLAGTGISFGMYVGKTPERAADVAGQRLRAGASREEYRRALARAQEEGRATAVHPPEERCSREEMRAAGKQPRILLTNVKQLELLLTRHLDVELFDGVRLEFLVFDEAHTFGGAAGAETACLVRRLRTFCGRTAGDTVCVATSATIADPERGPAAARAFAARFFGVGEIALVGEEYEPDVWAAPRAVPPPLAGDPRVHLQAVLAAVDAGARAGQEVSRVLTAMTGAVIAEDRWQEELYAQLAGNELVYQIAETLTRPRLLRELVQELAQRIGRPVPEEEILAWLALGAAARSQGRMLLRPVIHGFVRGIPGAVVSFPQEDPGARLWLSAEDEEATRRDAQAVRLPVMTCSTCGQHYFVHHVADFSFTAKEPGGGQAVGDRRVWRALDPALGGKRVVLLDRLISQEDDDDDPARTARVFLCRVCGALHPETVERCDGCGLEGPLVSLLAVVQSEDREGFLTRCVSCAAPGRAYGSGYREPARPVRAVPVSDVHVLAQDMVHFAERRRLLVFADNRQEAAFQAGWMRDHARRYRLRALMAARINQGPVSVGDLTAHLDDVLEADDALSRALVPEVWNVHRKEAEGQRHAEERKRFLRIQVLREVTTGVKQRIGLEPWGRLRVEYAGLDPGRPFIVQQAEALGLAPERLANGIASLLDLARRGVHLLDREGRIFSRFWQDGDQEIQRGYLPKLPGIPKGLKLKRGESDDPSRVTQWLSARDTGVRQAIRKWGVEADEAEAFIESLWEFVRGELAILAPVTLTGARGRALPNCAGTYQIDSDLLKLAPNRGLWRCTKCRRAQVRPTPNDRCLAWRCDGTLAFVEESADNYDLGLLDGGVELIRPFEHSAQVPPEDRERLERWFKGEGDAVNTLVCTPTLELGVDIGALDTVLLRNVPPLPSNYWQRVGRAGRRHRMAVNLTYARPSNHDRAYFAEPEKLLQGLVEPPRFNMKNEMMVAKHVHAAVLTRLYQLTRPAGGLSEADRQEILTTLERVLPRRITPYLFDEAGHVRATVFGVSPLQTVLSKHEEALVQHVVQVFSQNWPAEDQAVVEPERLRGLVGAMTDQLQHVIRALKRRLDWALGQLERLDRERLRRGALDPDEDALHRRCDRLVKRYKGLAQRDRAEAEGYDDVSTYGVLAVEGFLPGYGLEVGAILGTARMPRHGAEGADFELARPPASALREYVPGNLIYANGHRFVVRHLHLQPLEETTQFQVDWTAQAVRELGLGGEAPGVQGLGAMELPAVPICDVDLTHVAHISDDEDYRFQLPVAVFGYERGRHSGGRAYRWGDRDLMLRRGVHMRLVNVGAVWLIERDGRVGYPVCLVCGQSRSPFSSQVERDHFAKDHAERCGRPVAHAGFFADVVADALSLPGCSGREEAYSLAEALRAGAARVLEMEREDLEVLVIARAGSEEVDALLYDPMPGGSGLLDQLCERFKEVMAAALEITDGCPSGCARGCIDCLFTFRNAFFHKHLNRRVAADRFKTWGDVLLVQHDIPPKLPTEAPRAGQGPVNPKETALRAMLQRAAFPEPTWGHEIPLRLPLGSTWPDCFFPGDDRDYPGACVYLDGLSEHIHGNAATRERDRRIREELRARHYDVFEIAASDLDDRDAMARHFYRLARALIGQDRAREIRDQPTWFTSGV